MFWTVNCTVHNGLLMSAFIKEKEEVDNSVSENMSTFIIVVGAAMTWCVTTFSSQTNPKDQFVNIYI